MMVGLDEVSIRPARLADAGDIAGVICRAFECYEGRLQPPAGALRETPESVAAKLAKEAALVAVTMEGIAACVFYRPSDRPGEIYLGRLAVRPDRQGLGLASRLMAALEDTARAAGATALMLNVRIALPANRALFERLGFQAIGEGRHPGFADPTFTILRKTIGS